MPVEPLPAELGERHRLESDRRVDARDDASERFFGLDTLGVDMEGSAMHQTLLAAYDKLFAADR